MSVHITRAWALAMQCTSSGRGGKGKHCVSEGSAAGLEQCPIPMEANRPWFMSFCMIIADCSSQLSGQLPAALAALPINKHHTAVVWHWATKGNPGSKEQDFVIWVSCLGLCRVNHRSNPVGGGLARLEGTGGQISCRPCLDH